MTKRAKPRANHEIKREANGHFKKGVSANPKGRPPKGKAQREFEALCREYSPKAIKCLMEFIEDWGNLTQPRINAAAKLLEYAWGKPKQVQVLQSDIQGDGVIRFTAELDPRAKDKDDGDE